MSGLIPDGVILQYSTPTGDITHQGVLGSNASGSTLLTSTFPTTSTSTNLGHYHYTEATTNSLKFLNASGTGGGGHQFWHSSSTQAPIKVFETNRTGMFLNTAITNTTGNTNLNLAINNLTFTNDTLQSYFNNEAFAFKSNGATNVQINNSPENPNVIFTSATHNSQLTASDLIFDGTSLQSTLSNLAIKQTNVINVYNSSAVYADGAPPLTVPPDIANTGNFGWYFKNTTAGLKINWYIPTTTDLKVQDILGLYLRLYNVSTTTNDNTLFLTVYTTPDAESRMTYVITTTPTINTNYVFFENASGSCPNPSAYASTILQMSPSTVNNPRGTYGPTESIMFFSIGSNSASPVNSVECVVQKFGIMTPTGTQEFNFLN